VFASDGVWEYLSSQEVVDLVGKQVGYDPEPVQVGVRVPMHDIHSMMTFTA